MASGKKALATFLSLTFLFAAFILLNVYIPEVYLLHRFAVFFCILCGTGFTLYLKEKLIHKSLRRVLIHVGVLWTSWFVLELFYFFIAPENNLFLRNTWYWYYVPMHLLPLFFFYASIYEGRLEDEKLSFALRLPTLISFYFIFAAITNDRYRLLVDFNDEFVGFWGATEYKISFYLSVAWIVFLYSFSFVLALIKCRISISRKLWLYPLLPIIITAVWGYLYLWEKLPYINGKLLIDFPEALCYLSSSFAAILISIGLFPSNGGYRTLFKKSSISSVITDNDGNIVFSESDPLDLTDVSFMGPRSEIIRGDERICRGKIRGGYVYWKEDISELNRINEELKETGDRLSEEAELNKLMHQLEAERYRIDEKNKLYDKIAADVLPQSSEIMQLSEEAEADLSLFSHHAAVISVLCTYIKRYSNLILLFEKNADFSSTELSLSLNESLRAIERTGIKTALVTTGACMVPGDAVIELYTFFEEIVEKNIDALSGITVRIDAESPLKVKFILESENEIRGRKLKYHNLKVNREESVSYLSFSLKEGGARA